MLLRALSLAGLILVGHPSIHADPVSIEGSETRVQLLELFTSEGCSSCPPAEKWVNALKTDARLWREVVPVAFHVDYWDYIGWPDRFASPEHSERQRSYARRGYVQSVYTPGLVLGGEEWRSWFFSPRLKLDAGANVGPLRLNVDAGSVSAEFLPAVVPSKPVELHLAILGFGLETAVKAGENRGKKLQHDFVVIGYKRVDMRQSGNKLTASSILPKARVQAARTAVAAWVSARGDPFPVQAVGGWLNP